MNLDTRQKIVSLEAARELAEESRRKGAPPVAFITHFEVVRAGLVRKLDELAAAAQGSLFVILTDPEKRPLVAMDARADLAASMRKVVDYVVPSPEGREAALEAIRPGMAVENEEEDRARTARQLMEHVRSRSRS